MKTLVFVALAAMPLAAQQVTTASVSITSPSAQGCQSDPGRLTGGVAASTVLDFTYDQSTARLTLVVTNDSPIVSGEQNPQITDLFFNAPRTVTGMTLVSQSGPGTNQPDLAFDFGSAGVGCLGSFRAHLHTRRGSQGAIANAAAPMLGGRAPVLGPVTFEFDLAGSGLGALVAESIAYSFNFDSNRAPSSVAAKFQIAGRNGEESGFLGNGGDCDISFFTTADPRIGTTFDICQSGPEGCHDCMWVSLTPGPVTVGGIELPIGLPILFGFDFGEFGPNQEFCQPLSVPNDPLLIGTTLYFAVATFPASDPTNVSLSSAFELTIVE